MDKLLGEGNAGSPGAGDTDPSSPTNSGTSVDQIELTCNDQVSMTATVFHIRMNQQFLDNLESYKFTNCMFKRGFLK